VEDLLDQTNPELADTREQLARLAQPNRPADDDACQRRAMVRLRELGTPSLEVFRLQDELLGWHRLAPEDRQNLARAVDDYVEQTRQARRTELFMQALCKRCPEGAGCFATIVVGFLSAAFLTWLGFRINDPTVGLALFGVWVVFVPTCLYFLSRSTYRRFFTRRVIAVAESAGIDPSQIAAMLEGLKGPEATNPHVREMRLRLGMLKRLVKERRESVPAG
jgi:hypothetical protein